ncbi:hypothetical protein OIU74_014922 [Salix koriyanagi]|uniref:Uncharacterized protein n=1 Tax=Salix koriyanagi TaxID=2511006 RepID=A0A9Q0T072_9ROSI|nr:hypothetical protein OIU74_014922 [Salix koriyanagi]
MATTTCTLTTPSLMLMFVDSLVHPQDLTPSLISLPKTLSIYPMVSKRKSSKGVNFYAQTEAKTRPCRVVVIAALAKEVDEEVEETKGEEGGGVVTATVIPLKPKEGKVALPLEREREYV